jgi:chromosome segregation ATPase
MNTQTVAEAEASLQKAKADALEQRVAEARQQLKEVRARAKQLRKEHAVVTAKINETDAIVNAGRAEVVRVEAAIVARQNHTQDDVLAEPDDFEDDLETLVAYRQEVIQKMALASQQGGDRTRQAEIVLQVQHLQDMALNLVNIIENGGKFAGLTSGLSYVG